MYFIQVNYVQREDFCIILGTEMKLFVLIFFPGKGGNFDYFTLEMYEPREVILYILPWRSMKG